MPVNGRVWAFEDIAVSLLGARQIAVQAIDWGDQVSKEHAHSLGSLRPIGIGRGGYTGEGTLTVLQEGYDELMRQLKAQGKTLYGAQFSVTVTYGELEDDLSVDELPLCEFTTRKKGGKVGDTKLEVPLSFIIVEPAVSNDVEAI